MTGFPPTVLGVLLLPFHVSALCACVRRVSGVLRPFFGGSLGVTVSEFRCAAERSQRTVQWCVTVSRHRPHPCDTYLCRFSPLPLHTVSWLWNAAASRAICHCGPAAGRLHVPTPTFLVVFVEVCVWNSWHTVSLRVSCSLRVFAALFTTLAFFTFR